MSRNVLMSLSIFSIFNPRLETLPYKEFLTFLELPWADKWFDLLSIRKIRDGFDK